MDPVGTGIKIGIKIGVKIKIRAGTPTEDKESGLTITTTSEAETTAGVMISVGASHKTLDTHKGGTTNLYNLSNYNRSQDSNSHTSRTDNHRLEAGLKAVGAEEARGAEVGKINPRGDGRDFMAAGPQITDTEVKGSQTTTRGALPQPLSAKSLATTQTGQGGRGSG